MRPDQSLGDIRITTLARAGEGLTQWRPMLVGFLTLLLTFLVFLAAQGLGSAIGGVTGGIARLVLSLAAAVVMMGGISAVGVMLMDKAREMPVRTIGEAFAFGLACIPKFLLFAVLLLAAVLAFLLVAAVVYFVCKLPVIGAILAFVAHPVLVLVAAAALVALIWVIYPLFAPAIWSGLGFKAALASMLGIARRRLVEVVLLELVLYFIIGVICVLLFAGLLPASFSLTTMGAAIIGGGQAASLAAAGYGASAFMGNTAVMGLVSGLGVLYCVVGALMAQVMIMGMNLVYLQAQEGLDASDAEGALDDLIGNVRKHAEEAKDRAMAAAEQVKARAAKAQESPAQPAQDAEAPQAVSPDRQASAGTYDTAAQLQAQALAQEQAAQERQREAQAHAQAERQRAEAAAQEAARLKAQEELAREAARQEAQRQAERLAAEQEAARRQAENEAKARAEAEARAQAAKPQPQLLACPSCHEAVAPDDRFCAHCGHKLV
ncbi:zinc ribbon domain-containing protein [Comamonas terrae]|uniref:Zinc ribbon domain-containing protein n=1 Tax=Comamonas terrae TaxID=673548 RepID=A0ABW5USE3_9BURK|nr:zinc ribbon domain-containing protein [Comamonas terrae]